MNVAAVTWDCLPFHALSTGALYAIIKARVEVFVVEQNCPYQDLDGFDLTAEHVIAWSGGVVAAYARLLDPHTKFAEMSIGRVITTQPFRRANLGRELMTRCIERLGLRFPNAPIRIGAQAYLQRFYESFGFEVDSRSYLEDGIPHYEMLRSVD